MPSGRCPKVGASIVKRQMNAEKPFLDSAFCSRTLYPHPVPISLSTHQRGIRVAERYGFTIYDSLMIAAALEAGCRTLLTEDLQDGMQIESLQIHNPFLAAGPPRN